LAETLSRGSLSLDLTNSNKNRIPGRKYTRDWELIEHECKKLRTISVSELLLFGAFSH